MGIHRLLFAQCFEDVDLARRVVHMVIATDDVGDGHVDVIHHHAEVVGGCAVGSGNDQVVQLVIADFDATFDFVFPNDRSALWIFKAQHGLHALGNRRQSLAWFGPPCAVVAWLFFVGHLLLTQSIELFHAHVAGVHMAAGFEFFQHGLVTVHALHLVERAFVMVEAQPLHAFDDDVH